ncbi:MAG TPA: ABC transporter ATP-binding protein [Vicinamibacterales bacterium]|nr:ABC transporter ATP-binding protein [Vicinamibacterales bacterium]HPW20000.1 ABC transporter ATP-binding protein [Vicinamibacterales bacterium]
MSSDNALELLGVSKSYRGVALKDVFTLPRGAIGGLIGPNGAGKTTIVKLVMNLVRRDAREIRVFGLDNRASEIEVKSRVGFVYDVPGFWDYRTLDAHRRALGASYPRWSDATFRRLAGEFGLALDAKFKSLSHGAKTRFALAVALSHEAGLLIMDEPTAGLDPVFRRDLLKRFSALLQDEGKSVLFSTHITSDLERIADTITFVRAGQIVFSLTRDALLDGWAVVRADAKVVGDIESRILKGKRERAFGVEALVSDGDAARRAVGSCGVVGKVTLDDVMVLMAGEGRHAA